MINFSIFIFSNIVRAMEIYPMEIFGAGTRLRGKTVGEKFPSKGLGIKSMIFRIAADNFEGFFGMHKGRIKRAERIPL